MADRSVIISRPANTNSQMLVEVGSVGLRATDVLVTVHDSVLAGKAGVHAIPNPDNKSITITYPHIVGRVEFISEATKVIAALKAHTGNNNLQHKVRSAQR